VVSFTPQLFYPWEKNSQYPLDRRLCGPQSQFGMQWQREKIPAPAGNQNLVVWPVA